MENSMENEARKLTKITRELNTLTIRLIKEEGIGSSEFDLIHLVRHNPGIPQIEVSERLHCDKGAIAKRVGTLEKKGFLKKETDPKDKRKHYLYATDKAESLKKSKTEIESIYYQWLLEDFTKEEKEQFLTMLDKIYHKSKTESRSGFQNVISLINGAQK
jgi:DNA-binding MarR family transcriptional regulator